MTKNKFMFFEMINQQAEELNQQIRNSNPAVLNILSEKGKAIFFPKKGILAQTAEAKGKKINATIGIALEEDNSPMRLKSIANNINLNPEDAFTYASSFGKTELRKIWKKLMIEKNPSLQGKEISMPIVTSALTHGLSILGYLFIDSGDKIIMPDLCWENYKLIFTNAYGAEFITFPLFKDNAFNIEDFKKTLFNGAGKKIVLLNFPNNPVGYTPTETESKEIIKTIKEYAELGNGIVVFVDDAYFGLVYENNLIKESIFAELADIDENVLAVKVDGATKEDYVWGFRVGFITFGIKNGNKEIYSALESKTGGAVRGSISNASHLSQSLVLKAFTSPTYKEEKKEKYRLLKQRFQTVKRILKNNKRYLEYFEALPFNSGYFMCVKLKKGGDSERIRKLLLDKYSTGVIALNSIIRIAFSSVPTDKINELFGNIYNACRDTS